MYLDKLKTKQAVARPPTPEEIEAKFYKAPPSKVVLDTMVALKIVQHCRQSIAPVSGQLLGLDMESELHVTDSFPLLNRSEEAEDGASDKYAEEMLKHLRELNVDTNTIGWYQSTFLNVHIKQFLVETQHRYQLHTPESVVITFDHLVSSHGSIGLRAFRLTDTFVKLLKSNTFTKEKLNEVNFTFNDILQELPIELYSGGLSTGFLASLENQTQLQDQFEHFELSTNDFMQKQLETLSYCFMDLQREQINHANWNRSVAKSEAQQQQFIQKRKAQNASRAEAGEPLLSEDLKDLEIENPTLFRKPQEPSQLESLLIACRINQNCDQMIKFAGKSLTKQYAVKALGEI